MNRFKLSTKLFALSIAISIIMIIVAMIVTMKYNETHKPKDVQSFSIGIQNGGMNMSRDDTNTSSCDDEE